MCIIILDDRPNDSTLDIDIFKRAIDVNPDGLGLMYGDGQELHTWRSMEDLDGLYERYQEARARRLTTAVHFRKTTAGTTSLENCHPIRIRDNLALMHNGTIWCLNKAIRPEGISDTRFFVDGLLKSVQGDFLKSKAFERIILEAIDKSRMVFMDEDGWYMIYNSKQLGAKWWPAYGEAKIGNGVWFSKGADLDYIIEGEVSKGLLFGWGWNERPYLAKGKQDKEEDKFDDSTCHLVFDYGLLDWLRYDMNDFNVLTDQCTVLKAALFSVDEEDGEGGMPAMTDDPNLSTKGRLLSMKEEPDEVLEMLDAFHGCVKGKINDSWFYRYKVNVQFPGGSSTEAWAYFYMNMASESSKFLVPFGDWDYFNLSDEDEEILVPITTKEPSTIPNTYDCPICTVSDKTYTTTIYPEPSSGEDVKHELNCNMCMGSFEFAIMQEVKNEVQH